MKQKTYIFSYLTVFLFLFTGYANAQNTWSLQKCVKYAVENNIRIKQQGLNTKYSQNMLEKAKYDIYPNLNANINQNFSFGLSTGNDNVNINGNSMNLGMSLSSNMTLFNGFAKKNTIKQRDLDWQASLQDLEKAKEDISLRVASAYLDILFNKELVATSEEQIEISKQQIVFNKKQIEAGNMAKGKIKETEAMLANEELTLTNYQNQLQLSILNLTQLLELKTTDDFDIVTPKFDDSSLEKELVSANQVFAKAVLERPQILSKELKMKSAETATKIAKAQNIPVLSLNASIGDSYTNFFDVDNASFTDQMNDYLRTSVGLSLYIPIFNGLSAKLNKQNAVINYENSKYELELEKNNLLKEIQQVHANAIAAMKRYHSSKKALENTQEAFRYAQEKFNLGIVTPLEYNDSKNKVSTTQSSFIQSKYEYLFRMIILNFYFGKEIM